MPFIEPKEGFTDYWSGYYSTRPHIKSYIIESFNKLSALKTLFVNTMLVYNNQSLDIKNRQKEFVLDFNKDID